MFNIGGSELFFILLIVVVFFGSKKIPELARGIGKGLREMQNVTDGIKNELSQEVHEIKKQTDVMQIMMDEQIKHQKEQKKESV
ncbi:MAG: twin-arginine translocase TatA/TatE family subunit [Bacteroidetes bacterium]|nr:twin-arginine translocase TatA/TatE family subunit [Bacteroidota bacterium]